MAKKKKAARKGGGKGRKKGKAAPAWKPAITAFVCRACAGREQRAAIASRLGKGTALTVHELVCSGQLRTGFVLEALDAGADGVAVFGCPPEACRYGVGAAASLERVDKARRLLASVGIAPGRVARIPVSPKDSRTPGDEVETFLAEVMRLGPRGEGSHG